MQKCQGLSEAYKWICSRSLICFAYFPMKYTVNWVRKFYFVHLMNVVGHLSLKAHNIHTQNHNNWVLNINLARQHDLRSVNQYSNMNKLKYRDKVSTNEWKTMYGKLTYYSKSSFSIQLRKFKAAATFNTPIIQYIATWPTAVCVTHSNRDACCTNNIYKTRLTARVFLEVLNKEPDILYMQCFITHIKCTISKLFWRPLY